MATTLQLQNNNRIKAEALTQAIIWMYANDATTIKLANDLLAMLKQANEFLKNQNAIAATRKKSLSTFDELIDKRNEALSSTIEFGDELFEQLIEFGANPNNSDGLCQLQQDMQLLTKSIALMSANTIEPHALNEYQAAHDAVQARIEKVESECKAKQKEAGKYTKWEKVGMGVGYSLAIVAFAAIALASLLVPPGWPLTLAMIGLTLTMGAGCGIGAASRSGPYSREKRIEVSTYNNPVYIANKSTLFHAEKIHMTHSALTPTLGHS